MATAEAFSLEQHQDRVRKEWVEAELGCGRHGALVPELYALVAASPVDETLRGRLMLALYRSGRANEALEVCRDGRRRRADDLGMDPGPAMRELECAILRGDPSLDPPRAPAPARSAARESDFVRPTTLPPPSESGSVPPTLPPAPETSSAMMSGRTLTPDPPRRSRSRSRSRSRRIELIALATLGAAALATAKLSLDNVVAAPVPARPHPELVVLHVVRGEPALSEDPPS